MRLAGQEIAIVGAGIGGLAAAAALAQRQARVHVYEQAPRLAEVGAGLQVAPNGVAVLEALGLRDAAEACASLPEAVELFDHRAAAARSRGCRSARPPSRATAGPTGTCTAPTSSTCSAPAPRRRGRRSTSAPRVEAVAAGGETVALTLAGGARPRPRPRRRRRRRALGAPRRALSPPAPPRFARHVAWRGTVPAERAPAGARPPRSAGDDGAGPPPRHLSAARAAPSSTSSPSRSATPGPTRAGATPTTPPRLRRAFAGWGGAAGALLAAVETLLPLGPLRPCAAAALGRRAHRAARRRLPPDAALPRPGRDDGARGRLGPRRLPRPRRRSRAPASPPTRPRGWPGPRGSSAPRRGQRPRSTTSARPARPGPCRAPRRLGRGAGASRRRASTGSSGAT